MPRKRGISFTDEWVWNKLERFRRSLDDEGFETLQERSAAVQDLLAFGLGVVEGYREADRSLPETRREMYAAGRALAREGLERDD